MRALPLVIAALSLTAATGCTAEPTEVATVPVAETIAASPSATPSRTSTIRTTDWANVTLNNLGFLSLGDTEFRDGRASSGANTCTMLPGGARPAYAEYLTEEPASAPVTEDALILVECGSDGMDQALVPVQLGFDQRARNAVGFIKADRPTGPGQRMTFLSYGVDRGQIVTTVRKTDGTQETRRYRFAGGTTWERV